MANPNQLSANAAEADWHPASQTTEIQKSAERDRTLPETRLRRIGRLALRFLKGENNRAEATPAEGSAAELAERSRRNKESSDLATAEWDEQTEAIKKGGQPEAVPASPDSWDYGEGTPAAKTETNPADAKGWDYGEGTKQPEANYPGLDPNLYTNGGTAAEKQAWTETHPGWKSEQPDGA